MNKEKITENVIDYFQHRALENNSLFQVEIDVTSNCNAKCPFCFQGDHSTSDKTLSFEQIINLLDELRVMGTYYIGFSGGEPFLRDDFLDIIRAAKKRGFKVSIITNGMLLNNEIIDELSKLFIDRITISFHSMKEENYMWHFGMNSSKLFYHSIENIKYIIHKKMSLGIAVTVTKYNISELDEMEKFFTNLGLKETDLSYNLLLTGKNKINDYRPSADQIKNKSKLMNKNRFNGKFSLLCIAGKISCTINHDGGVHPCVFFDYPVGNIKEHSLIHIWQTSHYFKILRSINETMFTKCQACEILHSCNLCLATNINETGNVFIPSQDFCLSRKSRLKRYDES